MSYIGNSPGVASQRVETAFTATSNQTAFTPSSGYTLGYCDVYQNGVKLVNGDDYTASDGATVTLTTGAASGDSIVIVASFPRGLSDGYLKAEADAKYVALTGDQTVAGVKTFSGNVGIGTSSPASALHLSAASAVAIQLGTTGSGGREWRWQTGDTASGLNGAIRLYDVTGTSESMRIDSSGNVGIGVTSTDARLQVADTSQDLQMRIGTPFAGLDPILRIQGKNVANTTNRYADIKLNADSGLFTITAPDNNTPNIDALNIDSSGNVGIGTTSPSTYTTTTSSLVVVSSSAPSLSNGVVAVWDGATSGGAADAGGVVTFGGNDGVTAARTFGSIKGGKENSTSGNYAGYLAFATRTNGVATAERMRIDSSGIVLVGGTTALPADPGLNIDPPKLVVESATGGTIGVFRNDTTVGTGNNIGAIGFYGNDTTSNTPTCLAFVQAEGGGTHNPGDNPTSLVFATTPDGSSTAATAIKVLYGGGLLITRDAVTSPVAGDGNVFSGTYAAAQVSTNTNVASVSFGTCQYMRVGSVVTVSGQIAITATTAATDTIVQMSLPIASAFSTSRQLGGTGLAITTPYGTNTLSVHASSTNDCAELRLKPSVNTSLTYNFSFTYQVI